MSFWLGIWVGINVGFVIGGWWVSLPMEEDK